MTTGASPPTASRPSSRSPPSSPSGSTAGRWTSPWPASATWPPRSATPRPTAVDAARDEFDAASTRFSDAVAAKPGLTVLAASGTLTEFYVAFPPGFPDLSYYASLGLDLVEPTEHPEAGGYWQTLSWEEVGMYPADMILADVRGGSIDFLLDQMPASGLELPAVQADQTVAWPAASAVGYGNAAAELDALAGAVEGADAGIV